MTYEEIRVAAKAKMKGCRVCSQCDGRGCIGHIFRGSGDCDAVVRFCVI